MYARDRTRSSRGKASSVYAPRPEWPAVSTICSTTIIARNIAKLSTNGQTAYSAAAPNAPIAHIRFGPIRSATLPSGTANEERRAPRRR